MVQKSHMLQKAGPKQRQVKVDLCELLCFGSSTVQLQWTELSPEEKTNLRDEVGGDTTRVFPPAF